MDALSLLVLALAVYRLSRMVAWEDGPGHVFTRLRTAATTDYDQEGRPANFAGALLACPMCLSVWFGLAGAILYWVWPAATIALLPLALSGAATIILARED